MMDITKRLEERSCCWADAGDDALLDMSAALEIERLRSECAQLRITLSAIVSLAGLANGKSEPDPIPDAWSRYLNNPPPEGRFLTPPPARLPAFAGHEMTTRAWNILINEGMHKVSAVIGADPGELRHAPNVGKVTMGEIARLRSRLISDVRGKA